MKFYFVFFNGTGKRFFGLIMNQIKSGTNIVERITVGCRKFQCLFVLIPQRLGDFVRNSLCRLLVTVFFTAAAVFLFANGLFTAVTGRFVFFFLSRAARTAATLETGRLRPPAEPLSFSSVCSDEGAVFLSESAKSFAISRLTSALSGGQ